MLVGAEPDPQVHSLPSTGDPRLFDVLAERQDDMALATARGLALDGHDSPHARPTAAIRLLSRPHPYKSSQERYESGLVAGWLRWLAIDLDFAAAEPPWRQIQDLAIARRSGLDETLSPEDAAEIASKILNAITRQA